ncbi:MAG: cytochrome b [Alphaproteobacteria bacterium]|nr:cytochrome b [Alphaproteobacteria bacterium]
MEPGQHAAGYTQLARVLHWLTAALVLVMLPLGLVIANEAGGRLQGVLYNAHKSIGALILLLVVVRLAYRLTHRPPPLPDDIPPLQRLAAEATHWALYALLILQPLLGWAGTSAYPAPVPFFGLFDLPPLVTADRALSDQLLHWHRMTGLALAGLASLHVAAALYHHFVRRDRVLLRMLTG